MPLKVRHGLATAIVFAMEPWSPPDVLRWSLKCATGRPVNLRRHAFATMFVDAAWFPSDIQHQHRTDGGACCCCILFRTAFEDQPPVIALCPPSPGTHETRSIAIPPNRHTQQSAELWGLCWAMQLARRLGWRFLVLVTDSQVAGAQVVSLRERTWLHRQNRLLRGAVIQMKQCGLVVGLHWISTEFRPADPPSRLDTVANSSPLHALRLTQVRWHHVRTHVPEPDLLGVVWL